MEEQALSECGGGAGTKFPCSLLPPLPHSLGMTGVYYSTTMGGSLGTLLLRNSFGGTAQAFLKHVVFLLKNILI